MIALSFGLDMHEAIWLSNMINIFVVEHLSRLFFVFCDSESYHSKRCSRVVPSTISRASVVATNAVRSLA